ncbi:MAG: 5'-nucleotidase C-terminal domain-containing protein [Pseudomonadota bacterium]
MIRHSLIAVTLGLTLAVTSWGVRAEQEVLTILHVNDFDRMEESDGRGGFARFVTALRDLRGGRDHVLVTNGGDAISPSLMSSFDQGAHMIDLFNNVGFDVYVAGNHEFDFGPDVLKTRIAQATFPILTGNVSDQNGGPIAGAHRTWMTKVGEYTIGVLGLTTLGTIEKSSPGYATFTPVDEAAEALAQELRDQGADLVIALAHTDLSEDAALFEQKAVDVILSGDDHILINRYDGKTLMVESAAQADYITEINLVLDRVTSRDRERFVWYPASVRAVDTIRYEPDPQAQARVQVYLDRLSKELDVEIGRTAREIDSRRASVRTQETAIGNLIADVTREAVQADVAIMNGGGIRADKVYEPGTVLTRRDVLSELPFGNKTVKLEISGADLRAALENGVSKVEDISGRFPHVSGMRFEYDRNAPPGARITSVTVGSQPLNPSARYTIAVNDFIAGGGDGYGMLEQAKVLVDPMAARLMSAQVIEYIESVGTISPTTEGRIQEKG